MNYERYEVRVFSSGNVKWFDEDMKLHRVGGPANYGCDFEEYYKHGKLHNLNGPAVSYPYGDKSYYIEGICYEEKEFYKKVVEIKKEKKDPCDGKIVEIEGKKYKLQKLD